MDEDIKNMKICFLLQATAQDYVILHIFKKHRESEKENSFMSADKQYDTFVAFSLKLRLL